MLSTLLVYDCIATSRHHSVLPDQWQGGETAYGVVQGPTQKP